MGDARRHHVHAAHRREHARLEVSAAGAGGTSHAVVPPRRAFHRQRGSPRRPARRCRWSIRRTASRSPPSRPATPRTSTRAVRAAEAALDGAWGAARAGGEGPPAGAARARDPRSRRRAGADRGARLRQAAAAGARRRRRRARAISSSTAARRDKLHGETIPYPRRLHGADLARAARRHRPHHSLELSAADLRPLGRRRRSPPATRAW